MSNEKILIGMKAIIDYSGRGRKHVEKAIDCEGFPAVKSNGRWESNKDLIDEWQKNRVANMCGGK